MINYEWIIRQLDRDSFTGGIKSIHWRYFGREDSFIAETFGELRITPSPDSPDFIPFENVTKEDVISWLENELADELPRIREELSKEIELKKASPIVNGFPWA